MNNIAKPYQRFLAYLADTAIFSSLTIAFVYTVSSSWEPAELFGKVLNCLLLIMLFSLAVPFITSWMISKFGGTPGKILMGLKIVNPKGESISFWRAFLRNHIGYILSGTIFWAGFFWIFVDKERRAWHDMFADTYVLVAKKSMLLIGGIITALIIIAEIYFVMISVENFKANESVYKEIYSMFTSETLPMEVQ